MVVSVVPNSDICISSFLEEHLVGYPSFAIEDLHGFMGGGVVEEGFSEDIRVESSGYFFDFGEEGGVHVERNLLRVLM
jgi:hypothetical protein